MSVESEWLFEAPLAHVVFGSADSEWETHEQADSFQTAVVRGLPEGHEILTRRAAEGVPGVDLAALIRGVTRPDSGGGGLIRLAGAMIHSVGAGAQKSHALRSRDQMSTGEAVNEITNWIRELSRRAINAGVGTPTPTTFEWIGEAIHVIQDSFSFAHMWRDSSNRIGKVRRFWASPMAIRALAISPVLGVAGLGLSRTTGPEEHNFPMDDRDKIFWGNGTLKWEAQLAINASREYLQMMLNHVRAGVNPDEMNAFLAKYFTVA
jgi:hypothetical protein